MSLILHNHSFPRLLGMFSFNTYSFPTYPYTLIYIHTCLYLLMFSNLKHCLSCLRLILPSKSLNSPFSSPPLIVFFSVLSVFHSLLSLISTCFFVPCSNLFLKSKMMTNTIPTKESLNTVSLLSYQSIFSFLFFSVYFPTALFSLSQFLHLLFSLSNCCLAFPLTPCSEWCHQ